MHDVAKPMAHLKMKSKRKPLFLAIGGLIGLLVVLLGIKALQIGTMMSMPRTIPPTAVTSASVKEEDWAPTLSAIGSVSAVQGAVVSTELGGVVAEVNFQNGAVAKKGDVLMRLDTSSEEAQLHTAEADLELARANLLRERDLAGRKVVSKQELDSAESAFGQKQGAVDNMRAFITKKEVRAPFDGQLGIRQVNVGQSIDARAPVVQLTALDPVYVDFALPQQQLSRLATGFEVRVHTDAIGDREFKGKLTAINSMVDTVTRNVGVQATLENPDRALRPGMFVKVDVILPEKSKTLVIPGSAVSYAPYGNSVFVIEKQQDPKTGKESQAIRQQFVRVGEARGDFVSINEGLKAGETVVSTGVFKLRNGMSVTVNNDLAPKPQLNPTPADS
ncbi:MAG TPA: efflux RND transporter periplasmic adaptor subunit [Chthoniobacterales bacterium]|nr:efflux RND transporter periplasmic adaptor subunit [Chthoniobacterales bacterium]